MQHNNRKIASFLAIAFGFTWGIAGIGALFGINAESGVSYVAMAVVCMLGPALAAVIQYRMIEDRPWEALGLHPKLIRWKYLVWTCIIGLSIVPLTMLVIHLFGNGVGMASFGHVAVTGERFATAVSDLMAAKGVVAEGASVPNALAKLPGGVILAVSLLSALIAAFSVNLPFMLGEELGWRGYLYNATAQWSALKRVLFTGFFWGLWHAPLIAMGHNYPGHPITGIGLMVVFCVLLAFLFDWCRTRTNSVWGAAVLHGLINGSAGAMALFAWGGSVLVASPAGVAGFIAIAMLVLAIVVMDGNYRRNLFVATSNEVGITDPVPQP